MSGHGRLSAYSLLMLSACIVLLAWTGPQPIQAQELVSSQEEAPHEPRPFPRRGFGHFPHARGEDFRRPEPTTEASSEKGYFFLDGEYLPPPYEIRYADGEVTINGRKLTCEPQRNYFGMGHNGRPFGSGFGPARSDPWRPLVGELAQHLDSDTVVMSFPDQPLVVIG